MRGAEIAANIIGSLQLGSLASVIVFQFLSLADPPSTLDHEVILENSEGTTGSLRLEPSLAVDRRPVVRLGPPIPANDLFCDGALANDSYHRRAVITLGGLARIGQRYAIDFEIRKTPTQNYTGDASVNSNYAIYGHPLIAAADGRVVDVVDGIPDNTAGQPESFPQSTGKKGRSARSRWEFRQLEGAASPLPDVRSSFVFGLTRAALRVRRL